MASQTSSLGWPELRKKPQAFLAAAWCLPAAALAGFLSVRLGVWQPPSPTPLLMGAPAILLLGRILVWGWAFAAFFGETSLVVLAALGLAVDLLLLKAANITLRLDWQFLLTEIFAIGLCLIPAQLFARWTRDQRHLTVRNLMHFTFHSALFFAIWPLLITQFCGGNWHAWAERSSAANKLYLQLLFIPCVLLLTAMQEFYSAGRGTPMPQDAPQNLVTTGVYAYVANPMQIGKFGVLFGLGLFVGNPFVVAAAFVGLLYSVSVARWREDRDLTARCGNAWTNYRRNVRRWLPRWRPWIAPSNEDHSAALYLDWECGPCSVLACWLVAQRPTGLRILPLSAHPFEVLTRITYGPAGEQRETHGIEAIARALEHIHLTWAFCGWMLRLPMLSWFVQLVADAVSPPRPAICPTSYLLDRRLTARTPRNRLQQPEASRAR